MNARSLCYTAFATALLCVCAWVSFPFGGVPFTFQTFGVFLIGGLLGRKRALLAVAAYLVLGFCGAPVFSSFTGGAEKLLSPTGGYLFGFLPTAYLVGAAFDHFSKKERGRYAFIALFACSLLALLLCYAFGTLWFAFVAADGGGSGLLSAVSLCVLPYLPFDCIKLCLAIPFAKRLRPFVQG